MRKGRRLTISRSERFLWDHHKSSDRHMDGEAAVEMELMEEDVWSAMEAHEQPNAWTIRSPKTTGGERRHNGGGMGGLADNNDGRRKKHVASSAPVKVPEWSKISKEEESIESLHNDNTSDVGDGEMVPPHEYVARSRNGDGSSSMFLGVGRTLKGRDMRRVRDAVWSQTGFDG
ncbi:unnamed protein product [Brassica rapa]|uniref:Senescence regulator n=2 Tax=Brassica TaxID=3705 RepID=A0A3P5Z7K3_BRACM|nr:uncharacterized protein BNAA01G11770D [Brassica napus]CAF2149079.1 unnamed protein product [Brassica napus]CAG7887248.1 unnamed protein product [Brassica rapa]VDC74769.1 unnamed protein product [Brassica rapa]